MNRTRRDRATLAAIVWAVLVSQVLLYPGVEDLVAVLGAGADAGIDAGMWFLVAEFAAFVVCAGLWGAASDALGRRVPLVVAGALGGAVGYLALVGVALADLPFWVALLVRVLGGAMTIGAFSLGITMLMDLTGGHGRNMGAAGLAIGLGAALGSVVGGRLTTLDPLAPVVGAAVLLFVVALAAATVREGAVESAASDPADDPVSESVDGSVGDDAAEPGMGDVLSGLGDRPELLVPYAFGFIDRLTAGFFALVGVYYFRDVFGLSAAGAGGVLALFFVPFAVLQYPFGTLSDRVGRFAPVVVGSVLYGFAIVGVGIAPSLVPAAAMMVVVGVFGALVAPATMALVTDVAAPEERGAAMGGFNVFGSLGFLTGFLVGGTAASTLGYLEAFLVVGAMEVGIALLALRAVRRLAPGGIARTSETAAEPTEGS
ncbi:MFS transporter [Halobium salinum]|uniref:MFS transporter n=1 Tax=Halobium salinum TaxID=1364940 RepID=A0ABD5P7D3_9EURY|nr:MFS transporter [Halobium salinum]